MHAHEQAQLFLYTQTYTHANVHAPLHVFVHAHVHVHLFSSIHAYNTYNTYIQYTQYNENIQYMWWLRGFAEAERWPVAPRPSTRQLGRSGGVYGAQGW